MITDGEKITVLVVEPEKKPYVKEIGVDLAAMQAEVGGYIQAVYPYEEPVALVVACRIMWWTRTLRKTLSMLARISTVKIYGPKKSHFLT